MSYYEQKYLKYKNKYLTLKNNLNAQNGGNTYMYGTYVFFSKNFISLTETKGIDFNDFTNKLGSCAMFFRIGSTTTGLDVLHTYDTIYQNRSFVDVISSNGTAKIDNCNLKSVQSTNIPIYDIKNITWQVLQRIIKEIKNINKDFQINKIYVVNSTILTTDIIQQYYVRSTGGVIEESIK